MKCIRCQRDSKKSERTGKTCPGCNKEFAFDPNGGDPVSDGAWKAALDWVSSNGTVRFVEANLHHAVARRIKTTDGPLVISIVCVILSAALFGPIAAATSTLAVFLVPFIASAALVVAALRWRAKGGNGLTLEKSRFDALYHRWVQVHGTPDGLIPRKRADNRALTPEMARELESYSFDRAVFCDRDDTVDLLVGNDFHFENNCAILTADGYPNNAFPIIRRMLLQNPRLEIFVLHDATAAGCTLAHRLRHDSHWFLGSSARIYDVAVRPSQAKNQGPLFWHEVRTAAEHPALSEGERAWLSAYRLELSAFRPEQIIKRLFRAMHRLPEMADSGAAGGGDTGSGDGGIYLWTTDATASDGGGDSFG